MIRAIRGIDRDTFPDLFAHMFRMRAEVFSHRLGWDVTVVNGMEIDRFDALNPVYLFSIDPTSERLLGAVRLLPTTGPNMLRDVFPALMPEGPIESPLIWESSRFALSPNLPGATVRRDANSSLNSTTIELLCGLVEVAQRVGIDQIVSVFDARMARIFRAADCPYHPIGTPRRFGAVMTYAGLFDTTEAMRERLSKVGGFSSPVLTSHFKY